MPFFIRYLTLCLCFFAVATWAAVDNEALTEAQSTLTAAQAKLSTAQLEVQRGQTERDYYQDDMKRNADLYSTNAVAGKDYWASQLKAEEAEIALKELENGVTQAQSEVDAARAKLDKLEGR